jgi:transposase-like protein
MVQKSGPAKEPAEQVIREIRRSTRRQFSAEEKIRIVLSSLRGEDSIAELCRHREGSSRTSIIAVRRNFWRPARTAWPATLRGRNLGRGQGAAPGGQRAEGGSWLS